MEEYGRILNLEVSHAHYICMGNDSPLGCTSWVLGCALG